VTVTATAAVAGPGAGAASAPINTYFRTQDKIITSDASPEDKIPGLEPTDYKQTWRAMPNVEHFSPFITMFEPLFPTMMKFTTAMGINFPMEWPLAGSSGKHESWMKHTLLVYTRAMMGQGPKPRIAPTILVPTHEVRATHLPLACFSFPHMLFLYFLSLVCMLNRRSRSDNCTLLYRHTPPLLPATHTHNLHRPTRSLLQTSSSTQACQTLPLSMSPPRRPCWQQQCSSSCSKTW
jgi:hypothetical protein